MKPLLLTLAGLQSYRDQQTVDFRPISGCGLFGIFGPTGSGKSTVLDAMTLALYGQISRASHKTQGIINSGSEQAAVSLTFELSLDGERRTYLIERSYKRKKNTPDASELRVCRLIELDGDQRGRVLADKAGEVDAAVEKLLGLKFEDFTRAVVLPQNQFQEFLLLGKKDKSDMLERLFCLEEYGRELSRKVAIGRRRVEDELRTMEGSLEMLQDASDEAIAALQQTVVDDELALKTATARHEAGQREWAAAQAVHQLVVQKESLLATQQTLAEQAVERAADRQRLTLAAAAEPIWPVWQEQQQMLPTAAQVEIDLAALVAELADIDQKIKASHLAWAEHQTQSVPRQAAADVRIRQLERAADLAGQLDSLTAKQTDYTQEQQALREREQAAGHAALTLEQKADQLRNTLQEMRQLQQNLHINPVWRQDLEKWLNVYRQRVKYEQECEAEEILHVNLATQLKELTDQVNRTDLSISAELAEVIQSVAGQLRDGQPCPVCGSREHPLPATQLTRPANLPSEADLESLRRQLVQAEVREASSRRQIEQLRAQMAYLRPVASTILARQPQLDTLDDPELEMDRIYNQEIELSELQKKIPVLEDQLRQLQRQLQLEQGNQISLIGELAGREQLLQELAAQATKHQLELTSLLPDTAQETMSFQAIQQELAAIRGLLQQAKQESERLQADQQKLEGQRQPLEHRRIELQTRRDMTQVQLDKLTTQLAKLLKPTGFADGAALAAARLEPAAAAALQQQLAQYDEASRDIVLQLRNCDQQLQGRWIDDAAWTAIETASQTAAAALDEARLVADRARRKLAELQNNVALRRQKEGEYQDAVATRDRIAQIDALVRGNAFVEFVAEERLRAIVAEATEYLQTMTRYRYALELDADRAFVIRDQMNGGEVRLAGSLSGGETFMASLALALALSSQIQIRGQSRLEFFFLDEGFGSLDVDLLDIVMDSLERISSPQRLIGLISHVPELRHRIGTHLIITPADGQHGSRIILEHG